MKTTSKLRTGLFVLALISPLGLYLPQRLKAGDAWGEWGGDTLKDLVGYLPAGFEKLSALWNAPMPDYAFRGWEEKGLGALASAYVISALIGLTAVYFIMVGLGKWWTRGKRE